MPRETKESRNTRAQKIIAGLEKTYPTAHCELVHANPLELLVATILSAQCTDKRVNIVTEKLFQKYRSAADFAAADIADLEDEIRTTGFFKNKARNIKSACRDIVEKHGGKVPQTMEEILTLPGVARKTANVVLGSGFGIASGVVVDTHVFRFAHRLKLTKQNSPEKVEQDLITIVPKNRWILFSHQVIWFGRKICFARKPLCAECPIVTVCDSPDKTV